MLPLLMQRSGDCDWRDLSVVSWIGKIFELPSNFIEGFINGWWKGIDALRQKSQDYMPKVRIICKLVLTLVEKKVIDLRQARPWYEQARVMQNPDPKQQPNSLSSLNATDDLAKLVIKINQCQENKNPEGH